jgi:polyisoprenoid-binding protein YceI
MAPLLPIAFQNKIILMKNLILLVVLAVSFQANAQKYFSKTAHIKFFSHTSAEDIKADNYKSSIIIDKASGVVQVEGLIKMFEFEKALMQEHFNENYLESDTYPKATFKGKGDFSGVNFGADGNYSVNVAGQLTMHGATKDVSAIATIKIAGGKIDGSTKFYINPRDYNVKIPDVVKGQISEKIEVTVKAILQPLK